MRFLEATAAQRVGAGEGAAFVAEQLGLQQVARNRRGVQRDEGAAGAHAMAVQRPRHQLLAGAGLARDQHRDLGLGQPADGARLPAWRWTRTASSSSARCSASRPARARPHPAARTPASRAGSAPPPRSHRRAWPGSRTRRPGRRIPCCPGRQRPSSRSRAGRRGVPSAGATAPAHCRPACVCPTRAPTGRRAPRHPARRPIGKNCGWGCQRAPGLFKNPADGLVIVDDPYGFHQCAGSIGRTRRNSVRPGRDSNSMMPPCCCTKS